MRQIVEQQVAEIAGVQLAQACLVDGVEHRLALAICVERAFMGGSFGRRQPRFFQLVDQPGKAARGSSVSRRCLRPRSTA
jgi:hypothetical protein